MKCGQSSRSGDTTLTFYITPGNTAGTISTVVPLKDGNQWHVGILIGGRDTNYTEGGVTYLADAAAALSAQKASMDRLQPIVAKAGAKSFSRPLAIR